MNVREFQKFRVVAKHGQVRIGVVQLTQRLAVGKRRRWA